MRRQDIAIGVEYAETGALAYGREPRVNPVKIVFTSTEPHLRVQVGIVEEKPLVTPRRNVSGQVAQTTRRVIKPVRSFIAPRADANAGRLEKPVLLHANALEQPVGSEVWYMDYTDDRSMLPVRRWRRNADTGKLGWVEGLGKPADVHRTWADHEAKEAELGRIRHERDAPKRAIQARLESYGVVGVEEVSALLARNRVEVVLNLDQFEAWLQQHGFQPTTQEETA